MAILEIKDLHVEIEDKEILKGINLTIDTGKVNALMGKNGSGKSTLANTLMGHPKYKITKGKILFNGEDITEMPVNERSKLGLFLSFQHPRGIEGITIKNLVKTALRERGEKGVFTAKKLLEEKGKLLDVKEEFYTRSINQGFSGGEKKKMEILQLLSLNPKLAILDETDSGLDIDSLKTISEGINSFMDETKSALIITHYKRILEHIKPDKVFVMKEGKIIHEGDFSLVDKLEKEGYKFLDEETQNPSD
jgi:Fe-S cluster assembly ATP-binding protein